MPRSAHEAYLETQVRTATPQKLRLMLIDSAIRFGRQALECWEDEDSRQQRCSLLARCNDILSELYSSVRGEETALVHQVKGIYRFLITQLARVSSDEDPQVLREVIEVLEVERETWRQLCAQMPEAPERQSSTSPGGEQITSRGMPAIAPGAPTQRPTHGDSVDGLSLEA